MQRAIPTLKSFKPLINQMAYKWSNNVLTPDEIKSNANYCYLKCKKKFDPEKTKFMAFFHKVVKNECVETKKTLKEKVTYSGTIDIEMKNYNSVSPETIIIFKNILENLSPKAREIVQMVLEKPGEFYISGSPKLSRGLIYKKLKNLGWTIHHINNAFKEIKEVLKEK